MLSKRHAYMCVCVCGCIYMYPWLRVRWFSFSKKCLNKMVAGKVAGSFYWHGRDAESESELNPKVPNLPSTHIWPSAPCFATLCMGVWHPFIHLHLVVFGSFDDKVGPGFLINNFRSTFSIKSAIIGSPNQGSDRVNCEGGDGYLISKLPILTPN